MSSRPPSSTQPDQTSGAHLAPLHPDHGSAAQDPPSITSLSSPPTSGPTSSHSRLPPPIPLQPTYAPPSPQVRPAYQNVPSELAHFKSGYGLSPPFSAESSRPTWSYARSLDPAGHSRASSSSQEMPILRPYPPAPRPFEMPQTKTSDRPWLVDQSQLPSETARSSLSYGQSGYRPAYARGQSSGNRPSLTSYEGQPAGPGTVPVRQREDPQPPKRANDSVSRYQLSVRQQPIAARACGMGERDRRVVDPPPIVQLSLKDFNPSSASDIDALRTTWNVVHCALLDRQGMDVTQVPEPNDPERLTRRLMGIIVASPFVGTDPDVPASAVENARLGCFFIFPDLSCRQSGLYRLRFTLMQLSVDNLAVSSSADIIVGMVESDIFEVFSAKDFPGMRASTALTKELKQQGATVSVKKGIEGKAAAKGQKRGSNASEENISETGQQDIPKRKKG